MNRIAQRRSGFTLIELLVVVVVIGILAGIGVQNMSSAQDKARNSGVLSGTRSVFLGIESFKADFNGKMPLELVGDNDQEYLAADTDARAQTFISKYVPGARLPGSPWGGKPQEAMDSEFNNATQKSNPSIGVLVANGQPLPITLGYFVDAGGNNGHPPADGHGPKERSDFGYMYYVSDVNSGRYAVFGVGKYKKDARIFAVKSNYL